MVAFYRMFRHRPGCLMIRRRPCGRVNDAEGLVLHARTAMPLWLGERLNVGYAIDVLHPLAQ